jgi:hypothetical protein
MQVGICSQIVGGATVIAAVERVLRTDAMRGPNARPRIALWAPILLIRGRYDRMVPFEVSIAILSRR